MAGKRRSGVGKGKKVEWGFFVREQSEKVGDHCRASHHCCVRTLRQRVDGFVPLQ